MTETEYAKCPKCGKSELTAITYAYHSIIDDVDYGLQMEQDESGDEYAIHCGACTWKAGDIDKPSLTGPLSDHLSEPEVFTFSRVAVLMDVETDDEDIAWREVNDLLVSRGIAPMSNLEGPVFQAMLFDTELIEVPRPKED